MGPIGHNGEWLLGLVSLAVADDTDMVTPIPVGEPDWEALLRMAREQSVVALLCDGVQRLPADRQPGRDVVERLLVMQQHAEAESQRHNRALRELLRLCNANDIPAMVLKGLTVAACYPKPEHRECADVDVYHFGREDEVEELLSRQEGVEIVRDKAGRHNKYLLGGVTVECHRHFVSTARYPSLARYGEHLERLLREEGHTRTVDFSGAQLVIPSPTWSALMLLRHMADHFGKDRMPLRQVVDWAMLVRAYHGKIDWKEVMEVVEWSGLRRFFDAVNAIVVWRLHVERAMLPCEVARYEDDRLAQRVMADVMVGCEAAAARKGQGGATAEIGCRGSLLCEAAHSHRRFWRNAWKHRLTHQDPLLGTYLRFMKSFLKPE